MAEIATIARPYAEALFKAAGADAAALKDQVSALAQLASDEQLRQFADDPKVVPAQVFDLVAGIALQKGVSLDAKVGNLLRAVLDNGRLGALPEIAAQFAALGHHVEEADRFDLPNAVNAAWPTLSATVPPTPAARLLVISAAACFKLGSCSLTGLTIGGGW